MEPIKIEEVIVQVVVRTKNDKGQVIGERVADPVKIFRAAAPDFWEFLDKAVALGEGK